MTTETANPKRREPPCGAVFHRCALQVNPHDYVQKHRGQAIARTAADHARAIIEEATTLGISVLAITDHHDVSSIPYFVAAAEGRPVHVFPGFELTSSEGVHVLCIYGPGTSLDALKHHLGAFGIPPEPSKNSLSTKPFVDILEQVRHQGGVAIAAHATNDGGLFRVLDGQARVRAWQHPLLLAIQIPGPVADLPVDLRRIVTNQDPNYGREHQAEPELPVAVVNAGDVVSPESLREPGATCWIKMSKVGIEGLRQAFLDPGSRIRLGDKLGALEQPEHAELLALTWETEGFLKGCSIRFNPNLNVLVGGRGAGKSTIVESIRAVLGLEPLGDDARITHEGIVRQVLRSGTKISLHVRSERLRGEYTIERTLPNPPLVRDDSGAVSKLTPKDVLPRIEVFGQHEISDLAKSDEKRTRLLDRFQEQDDGLRRRRDEMLRALAKNRSGLLEAMAERQRIDERLTSLPGLEETLAKFQEKGLEERLKEQSLLVREERILESVPERMAGFRACLESLQRDVPIDLTFLSSRALEGLPGRAIFERLPPTFARLEGRLAQITKDLGAALQQAETEVDAVRVEWSARKQQVQAAYEKILRELQKSRVDGEEFIRLRRQIEDLRPLREKLALAQRIERDHGERRRSLLAEWEDLKAEEFRRLEGAAKKVNKFLRDRVRVEVTQAGQREPLVEALQALGGRLKEALDVLRTAPTISLPAFVEACRAGAPTLVKEFGLPMAQAQRLALASPEALLRIEELELPTTTTIHLNTAQAGESPAWRTLEDLSTGQKATAILLLLLLESDAPLIVDQPEDDLDNRFITEGVVPRMREEKLRRQFVFTTHNANIPVLGDAELIIGLTPAGEAAHGQARILPEHVGSIDDEPVRVLVEEILEGGREAFERRRRKYGF